MPTQRIQYRLRGTVSRQILWTQVIFLLATASVETVVHAGLPCSRLGLGCEEADVSINVINLAQLLASYGSCGALGFHQFFTQTALAKRLSQRPDHWTMASSRDMFTECSHVIKCAQNAALALIGGLTMLGAAVCVSDVARDPYGYGFHRAGENLRSAVEAVCGGPDFDLCHLAYSSYVPVFMASSGALLYMICSYLLTPTRAWSPVFQEAARQECDWRHTRLPFFTWAVAILGASAFGLSIHLSLRVVPLQGSKGEMVFYLAASWAVLLSVVTLIMWMHGLHQVWFWPRHLAAAWRMVASTAAGARSLLSRSGTNVQAIKTGLWATHRSAFLSFEASLRFRQIVLLLLHVHLWVFDATTNAWAYNTLTWLFRALAAALLVFTRDAPANFYDLLEQPGFGLVADKRDLCRALRAHLAGQEYRGDVRRYKASTLRMKESLAVSYRWQPEEVELCSGFGFNMSRWQMEQLLSVLQACNCQYVWIDHISIPQLGFSDMKRTLLSRMMAVYASAGYTLVLRSLELEGCRYHQRAWTLQEFCNASEVIVLTQEDQSDIESSYAALREDELEMAMHMRDAQLRKVADMKPVWLYGAGVEEMDEAEAVRRQETYLGLVGRLHAEHPADLVRALYPLVFDRPVESHEELMELVRQISSRTVINPRCSEQSAYDLRVLINTYTDVGDVLSRVASRISSTGAVELIQRIKRETGSGAVYWEHHGGTRADDRHEDDMLVQVPGSSWVLASSGSIPSSKQQGREAEIIHGK